MKEEAGSGGTRKEGTSRKAGRSMEAVGGRSSAEGIGGGDLCSWPRRISGERYSGVPTISSLLLMPSLFWFRGVLEVLACPKLDMWRGGAWCDGDLNSSIQSILMLAPPSPHLPVRSDPSTAS